MTMHINNNASPNIHAFLNFTRFNLLLNRTKLKRKSWGKLMQKLLCFMRMNKLYCYC